MLIAQITDIHIGFDPDNPDEFNIQRLRTVLTRLTAGPNRPDLLLMSGDLTEFGDAASYTRLAVEVAGLPFPVLAMTGNHDLREPLLAAFPETPNEGGFVHYVVDLPELRLIVLDTLEEGRHGGAFCEARATWLTRTLDAAPDRPTVVAMHHPPFESGLAWLDGSAAEPWMRRFAEATAGRAQIKAIVAGHLHRTIHTAWNGFSVTVCKSTAPLVALDLNPIDADVPDGRALITDELPGYALHRWDGSRLVTHFESVGEAQVLARFDEGLLPTVQMIDRERPK